LIGCVRYIARPLLNFLLVWAFNAANHPLSGFVIRHATKVVIMKANRRRIAIITASAPGDGEVGEIWMRDICKALSEYDLSIVLASARQQTPLTSAYPSLTLKLPSDRPTKREVLQRVSYELGLRRKMLSLVEEAFAFISEQKPDLLLVVPFGYLSLMFCALLLDRLQEPVLSVVWDPPERQQDYSPIPLINTFYGQMTKKLFYKVLRRSSRCIVMSEGMAELYRSYATPVVIRSGIDESLLAKEKPTEDNERYQIGFAGSLFGRDSFQAFIKALDSTGWIINNRPVRMVLVGVVGFSVNMFASKPAEIVLLGRHSRAETIEILSQCHMLYLPYPMNQPLSKETVKVSFPTKLSTYVAANVPIFYHGPKISSVGAFIQNYPIALHCSEIDTEAILNKTRQLLIDDKLRETIKTTQRKAFEEHFSWRQFQSKIVHAVESCFS